MLNLRLWLKPTSVVFCLLQTQESGALQKLLGARTSWQGLLGDAGRKGSNKRLCKWGNQRGQKVRKGKERRDEARVVWTGCPQVTDDGRVWFLPGMEVGRVQRGRGKGQEGAVRCPRGGPQSARGLDVRKAASLRPLRDQNRWGGAPTTQCSRCKFKSETPKAKPPALSQRPLLPRSPLGPPVLPLRLEVLRFTSELAHHSTTQSNLWDKPSER